MTVVSALTALNQDIQYARTAIINKGGTVTVDGGSSQLATDIQNIPSFNIITATNKTGSTINADDKVWIKKVGDSYNLIPFYKSKYIYNLIMGSNPNLTFDEITGIASNFVDNNGYFTFSNRFVPDNNPWEMVFRFKTPSTINAQNILLGSASSAYDFYGSGISIEVSASGYLGAGLSSNGKNSWDIGWFQTDSGPLSANMWYWVKIKFTGTEYILSISTNGIDYNLESEIISTTPIYTNPAVLRIGQAGDLGSRYWRGSVDLSQCYAKINEEIVWTGAYQVKTDSDVLTGYAQESIANNATGNVKTLLPEMIEVVITADADDADITVA